MSTDGFLFPRWYVSNTPSVHSDWAAQNASYMGDVAGEIEQVGNDATEPVDTLALACAMAEAGKNLEKALEHAWALYTPQDAAVVASALHASMASAVTNLRALSAAVKEVAARGDFALPGPTDAFISADDETPGDALDRLETVADEVEGHLAMLLPAISVLDAAPGLYRPASDVHGTMVAVAKALGPYARLHTPDIGHAQGASEDPCGCHIRIHVDGELYYFDLTDIGWSLLRDSDALEAPDGSKTWHNPAALSVRSPLAHPDHLAEAVMHAIKNHA